MSGTDREQIGFSLDFRKTEKASKWCVPPSSFDSTVSTTAGRSPLFQLIFGILRSRDKCPEDNGSAPEIPPNGLTWRELGKGTFNWNPLCLGVKIDFQIAFRWK